MYITEYGEFSPHLWTGHELVSTLIPVMEKAPFFAN